MAKMKPGILEYSENNLKLVSKIIMKNLTPDLLIKKWVERNSHNPTFGHCHTASICLQRVFSTKYIKPHRAMDEEGIWHWWVIDINGKIIDLTAEQYAFDDKKLPYDEGSKASSLGFKYRERVDILFDRVKEELICQKAEILNEK